MEKKIEVRNLRVSFRTNNGTVKAVRDISFDVKKGETLAIVGESGSGKSVTAKAMLGILAGNSIIESGEIIYDGQDLLKLTKKEISRIRGNKVTMIFQDPLSSLDPIMKIGKQMTEATLLNGRTNRRNARRDFRKKVKELQQAMLSAGCDASEVKARMQEFVKALVVGSRREHSYRLAHEYAESSLMSIEQLLILMLENDDKKVQETLGELVGKLEKVSDEFLFQSPDERFTALKNSLRQEYKKYKGGDAVAMRQKLEELKDALKKGLAKEKPDFFSMDSRFMDDFLKNLAKGIACAQESVVDAKKKVVAAIEKNYPVFEQPILDIKACRKAIKEMEQLVTASIDRVSLQKNSNAYTFCSTMENHMERYAEGVKKNPKETTRVEKQEKERKKKLEKTGDAPQVVPAVLIDLELTKQNMIQAMRALEDSYKAELVSEAEKGYGVLAADMVDYLKELSCAMVNVITKQMAYDKAIRIMEDVGIKEPRKRFEQYPFEFSGGMRQRIVIAIAIAAHPDVLICDEPTTALDVTIQAQILELINDLKQKRNLTVIFITHDLGVVANMADKVAVMYAGKIVEQGTVDDIFYHPAHPYTWALLASMPDLDTKEKLEAIPGTPPNMIYPPVGDAFAARNKYALQIDFKEQPPLFRISDTHFAATWLLDPRAPKIEPPKIVTDRIRRMQKLEEQEDGQ
ncbi:MAG: oligopeptide/dipeptide ABC transporter ATP-binding protein [Acetatifactor sp.]